MSMLIYGNFYTVQLLFDLLKKSFVSRGQVILNQKCPRCRFRITLNENGRNADAIV